MSMIRRLRTGISTLKSPKGAVIAYFVSSQTLWIKVGECWTKYPPFQSCALSPFLSWEACQLLEIWCSATVGKNWRSLCHNNFFCGPTREKTVPTCGGGFSIANVFGCGHSIIKSFHCHNMANSHFLGRITGLLINGVANASPCLLGPLISLP